MPPLVMLRVGPIGGLGHCLLSHSRQGRWGGCGATPSCTEQGQSGGWGTAPCHSQNRAYQGGWGSVPCHTQSRANQGVGALPLVMHRAGQIRGLGRRHSHTQGRADGDVMALPHHTQSRAHGRGWLGCRTLSHKEPQGDQGVGEFPPIRHRAGLIRGLGHLPLS
uniref:Uncharacterized protein n=1 Tax=Myotis myotis TaxID=51298 RepID=A0A7J7ZYK8_MYOMY|nr:hypothetical protein mMyoMyo1_009839 [Myotis myotis]